MSSISTTRPWRETSKSLLPKPNHPKKQNILSGYEEIMLIWKSLDNSLCESSKHVPSIPVTAYFGFRTPPAKWQTEYTWIAIGCLAE
jgi:hypothetical protein